MGSKTRTLQKRRRPPGRCGDHPDTGSFCWRVERHVRPDKRQLLAYIVAGAGGCVPYGTPVYYPA